MRANLENFLRNALLFTEQEAKQAGIEKVTRVKLPSASNLYSEIKVLFTDMQARGNVSSKGRLLASYTDPEGKPQASFRMEIPDYLAANHKLLNDYGFRMKRAHG